MSDVFDFSRVPLIGEDAVVRTTAIDDEDMWVETLSTPSGRVAFWNHGPGFDSVEEAMAWHATVNA